MSRHLYNKIAPIITETYGDGAYARDLAYHLDALIEAGEFDYRGREHGIMQTCWMWFSGGDTAASVARKIEAVLNEKE